MTSQKQAPSPIDLLGAMQQAVNIERRRTRGGASTALRDVLAKCVGDYNRMVTKKSHRVDTNTKNLCLNMRFGFISKNISEIYKKKVVHIMAILVCLSLFPLCPQRFDQENVRELFKLAIQASHQ